MTRRLEAFTLAEVLMVLVIVATMTTAIHEAIRGARIALERTGLHSDSVAQSRSALGWLSRDLRNALRHDFSGSASSLCFTATRAGAAARVEYRLEKERLLRRETPLPAPPAKLPAVLPGDGFVPVARVVSFAVRYQDGAAWSDRWDRSGTLPQLVELTVAARALPERPPSQTRTWVAIPCSISRREGP